MRKLIPAAVILLSLACAKAGLSPGTNAFETPGRLMPTTKIDKLVFPKLAKLNLQPVLCSDAVFIRRAFLDVIGTLPTAKEAKDFIQDPDIQNKRRLLIDKLLEGPEFADYWSMRWGDLLRIKAEFPVNLWPNAAQAYHRWVWASLAQNKPYDKLARELLTSSGSNFRVGPVNFYRAIQNRTPDGIAATVALTFMGTRLETWPTNAQANLVLFFSQVGYKPTREWKEENVFWDPLHSTSWATNNDKPNTAPTLAKLPEVATFPDGTHVKLTAERDPRQVFADWLITPKNPWFTRNIVNRSWAWFLGRGIIHEPDDIRDNNPPSNPALLAYLQHDFIAGQYDLKRLFRLILNSQTYQLSSMPRCESPEAEANFASYGLRRLDAEVLIDAINKITGATDLYTSPIPEPFTYIPEDKPAIALADGSITSPFLALFGRSARATGMENERDNKPVPAQWLHLLNSSHIARKIDQGPKVKALIESGRKPAEILEELYLTILSRFPTPDEVKNAETYSTAAASNKGGKSAGLRRRDDWVDLAWALINSTEFLYRH